MSRRRKRNYPAAATNAAPQSASGGRLNYEAISHQRRVRFNPLRALTPEWLSSTLDGFNYGDVRQAALLWEAIAERDDKVMVAKPKRELAISLLPWEVLTLDDSPEAEAHKKTLEYFWNNVRATDAYDRNVCGGFSRLVRQMMTAVSYRYAVHHIVWQPSTEGLSAKFEFVPLYFFENRTGRLRFTPDGISLEGQELEEGNWLTTMGDGLMMAASICYMFKRLSLQDWVAFNDKFGIPGVHAETSAGVNTPEWGKVVDAVRNFMNDWGCVTNQGTKFNLLQASGGSNMPFAPLVEEMNRAIAAMYRGGDLSTMSAGQGSGEGASLQGGESDLFEDGDALMITEALQEVERWVIRFQHGSRTPKAYIVVKPPVRKDAKLELEIDKFLLDAGAPISISDALERYNRTQPKEGERLLVKVAPPASPFGLPAFNSRSVALNQAQRAELERFVGTAVKTMSQATAEDLQALRDAVLNVAEGPDGEFLQRVQALRRMLPKLREQILAAKASRTAMEKILGSALASGLTE